MPTYAEIHGQRASGRTADVQPDRTTMRILVIEDDRDAADYLIKAFREVGHVADLLAHALGRKRTLGAADHRCGIVENAFHGRIFFRDGRQ